MIPLVLTVVGPYDPRIVRSVSEVVADHEGNWNESRLVHLAGRYAGVVKITVPEAQEASLVASLEELEGVRFLVERGGDDAPADVLHKVEVTATDRPGIVRDVTAAVVARDGQIERFRTEYVSAPMAGGVLFYARIWVRISDVSALRAGLQAIADDLLVDIHIDDQ